MAKNNNFENIKDSKEVEFFYDSFYYPVFVQTPSWHKGVVNFIHKYKLQNESLLDIWCYRGHLFRDLINKFNRDKDKLSWLDISSVVLEYAKQYASNLYQMNVEEKQRYLNLPEKKYKIIILTEIIEHIHNLKWLLDGVDHLIEKDWYVIVSFPNYLNILWLLKMKLSEILGKKDRMYLQPVEKKYNYFYIKWLLSNKFEFLESVSYLFLLKNYPSVNHIMNKCGLGFLGFCPVMVFHKK